VPGATTEAAPRQVGPCYELTPEGLLNLLEAKLCPLEINHAVKIPSWNR
jgi:hypothetical protein